MMNASWGYGYEDIDLPARLRRLGIKKAFHKIQSYRIPYPS